MEGFVVEVKFVTARDRERWKSCGGTYKKEHRVHLDSFNLHNLDKLPGISSRCSESVRVVHG